ncbi:hypothetical protein J7L18_00405 [Candidatus Bathyarchaeota archaeon]|nr:hypothetical protein [Candidatus Bathyarchaeota archaeon]
MRGRAAGIRSGGCGLVHALMDYGMGVTAPEPADVAEGVEFQLDAGGP